MLFANLPGSFLDLDQRTKFLRTAYKLHAQKRLAPPVPLKLVGGPQPLTPSSSTPTPPWALQPPPTGNNVLSNQLPSPCDTSAFSPSRLNKYPTSTAPQPSTSHIRSATMSSIASSASIKSGTSSSRTRSRRPPSPPSMYQFDFVQPKAPKPLPKIEKKPKAPKPQKSKPTPLEKIKEEKKPKEDKKLKEDKKPKEAKKSSAQSDAPSRGFAFIWGVKGKRKAVQDLAPTKKSTSPPPSPSRPSPSSLQSQATSSLPPTPASTISFASPPPSAAVAKSSLPPTPISATSSTFVPPPPPPPSKPSHITPVVTATQPPNIIPQFSKALLQPQPSTSTLSLAPSQAPSSVHSLSSTSSTSSTQLSTPASYTPPSPDFHVVSDADIRARRIEKLTRTLGQQPPVDLVFPPFKRTYAADEFPPPPADKDPLYSKSRSGSQTQNAGRTSMDQTKEKGKPLSLKTQLTRRNSLSLLSLPATALNGSSSKKSRRPSTASSPTSPISFASASPTSPTSNSPSSFRPVTSNIFTPTHSPTSTISSARRPSTASASSSMYSRDLFTSPPSPSRTLPRAPVQSVSHESLVSATTASSSSCYSVDTFHSSQLDTPGIVDVHNPDDEHHAHDRSRSPLLSPIVFGAPPSPSFVTIQSEQGTKDIPAILERDDPTPTPEDELAAYEEGFAYFNSSPVEETPKLRTFVRAPVHRNQPPSKKPSYSSYSRPSTAPASPTRSIRPSEMRPGTPFIDTLVPVERGNEKQVSPIQTMRPASRRERRQGWSGEWNRDDMQDVIKKLRTLK